MAKALTRFLKAARAGMNPAALSRRVVATTLAAAGMALAVGLPAPAHEDDVALGSIRIETPDGDLRGHEFRRGVIAGLRIMRDKSPYLAQLLKASQEAPFPILVHPLMEDPKTYFQGQPYRPHAGPAGPPSVSRAGSVGYPTLVYLTLANVNPYWSESKRGALAHELVHAIDFAYGRAHRERMVAERRAMFMENLWRDVHGWVLAEWYHDRQLGSFETLEYQRAKGRGAIARCVEMILTVSSFDCP